MKNEAIEKRIRDKINKLPFDEKKAVIDRIRKKNLNVFKHEKRVRQKYYPLKDFVPNVAQERALSCYMTPKEGDYPYPKYNVFTGGNGVGKTVNLAVVLAGCSQGNRTLNKDWFDFKFFDMMEKRRKKRPLVIWIVCKKGDMTKTGSVYNHIKKLIPTAEFSGKTNGQYYTFINIPSRLRNYCGTHVSIKTFDMDILEFSGSDCDVVLFNEPLPNEDKFDECAARIRAGGYIAMFMTPLSACAYVQKMVKNIQKSNLVFHAKGSIWENCADRPETRGHLKESDILALIQKWRSNPITLKARVHGEFTFLSGAVFPIFNNDVHVIKQRDIQGRLSKRDLLIQAVDHHPSKRDVGVWMKLDALNVWHVVAEYPFDPWEELLTDEKSIKHYGYDFGLIELGKVLKFNYMKELALVEERFGDPNAFRCKQSYGNVKKTIQDQYLDDCDLFYRVDVDNSIELRHDEISNLLYYDSTRPLSISNSPRLFVYETCENVINAFNYYLLKEDGKPEEEWKDWIDCIGYIVTSIDCYVPPNDKNNRNKDEEFEAIYGSKNNTFSRDLYPDGYYPETQHSNRCYGNYSTYGIYA